MSTVWPLGYRTYAPEDADQRTSPEECMNLQFLTRMRRLCASVGRVASDKQPTAKQSEVCSWHECDLRGAPANVRSWESNGLNADVTSFRVRRPKRFCH
jgi:hypothetical protein